MHKLHTFEHRLIWLYTWPQQAKKGKKSKNLRRKCATVARYLAASSLRSSFASTARLHRYNCDKCNNCDKCDKPAWHSTSVESRFIDSSALPGRIGASARPGELSYSSNEHSTCEKPWSCTFAVTILGRRYDMMSQCSQRMSPCGCARQDGKPNAGIRKNVAR